MASARRRTATLRRHLWGHVDTDFRVAERAVSLSSDRYSAALGAKPVFYGLLDFFEEAFCELPDDLDYLSGRCATSHFRAELEERTPPRTVPFTVAGVTASVTFDDRLAASHGQTLQELLALVHDSYEGVIEVVDAVFYPTTHDQARAIVVAAAAHSVAIVPVGGSTGVSQALCMRNTCSIVVAVSTTKLNAVHWVDVDDSIVCVGAGITGAALEAYLNVPLMGVSYTCGHFPDSSEFSTAGGWVATKASGMKRSRYGNIEDLCLGVDVVLGTGEEILFDGKGRVSEGIPFTPMLGSEGSLGLITRVYLRIFKKPRIERFVAFVIPRFEDGVECLREIENTTQHKPSCLRLVDFNQFRIGKALSVVDYSAVGVAHTFKERLKRAYIEHKVDDPSRIGIATAVFEGDDERVVEDAISACTRIFESKNGFVGDEESARRAYFTTYVVAYLRDFCLTLGVCSDSFECFCPWRKVEDVIADVSAAVTASPRKTLFSTRVSQSYSDGVCLYFYVCVVSMNYADFEAIETSAHAAILSNGGSISHHHGVGKLRRKYVAHQPPRARVVASLKAALDPHNVFALENL